MATDGVYKWYVALDEESERWNGPYDTREEAINVGRDEYDGDPFCICESDKALYDFGGMFCDINDITAAELDIYAPDFTYDLLTRWSENEEHMGEDGWEHDDLSDDDHEALRVALSEAQKTPSPNPETEGVRADAMSEAFEKWANERREKFGPVFWFGHQRVIENIAPLMPAS